MELKEAIAILERYGIKPSLGHNGVELLRQVAEIIDRQDWAEAERLAATEFEDGDFLILKHDQDIPYDMFVNLAEGFREACGKKIAVVLLPKGTEVSNLKSWSQTERKLLLDKLLELEKDGQ